MTTLRLRAAPLAPLIRRIDPGDPGCHAALANPKSHSISLNPKRKQKGLLRGMETSELFVYIWLQGYFGDEPAGLYCSTCSFI